MAGDTGFAEVNATRLYYEVAGSGHPLVLIHGTGQDTRMWDDQFEEFARNYKVIRYDVRGYGRSALPSGEAYYDAEDLRALLTHLAVKRAHILGLSMGGWIAIEFALSCPEIACSLNPVGARISGDNAREIERWFADMESIAKESGVEAAKRFALSGPIFAPAMEKPDVAARLGKMVSDYSWWHFFHEDPSRASDPPAIQRLATIRMPTLVIIGERDVPELVANAQLLHERIPGADLVVLPGVGHVCNMEAPEQFNRSVLEFLDGVPNHCHD